MLDDNSAARDIVLALSYRLPFLENTVMHVVCNYTVLLVSEKQSQI